MQIRRNVLCGVIVMVACVTASRMVSAQVPVEVVHVVITGGPNAGTYDATGVKAGCSAGLTGPGSFGNQLSSTQGAPTAFNSLQLIVPNAKAAAAAAGSSEVMMVIGFGPLMHRTASYTIDTQATSMKKTGKAVVKLQDAGSTAKVMISGTTDANVKIDATIDCKSVVRQ